MSDLFISRFTPSTMSADDLRGIFVQRSALLNDLEEGLIESIETEAKHHYLLVGPRGIGKSHLISLLFHKLNDRKRTRNSFLIAWLREEEWVLSFTDLIMRIINALREQHPQIVATKALDLIYSLPPEEAQRQAVDLLLEVLGSRTLIILVENLKDIFDAIGEEGQKRLRALIQQTSKISVVASTPSLFGSVSLRTSPFYGFFEIHHLSELSVNDAKQLLTRIAELEERSSSNGELSLAAKIQSVEGQAKVEAIYHLAGGNHRVYIILSQFIKSQNFDDIVKPFLEMIDNLTPYYQSQIGGLSPQQRKIIQFICDCRYAVSVKQIARNCFMTPQSVSAQLMELKDREFVKFIPVGRENRYEVKEPLMRFCMEAKKARGAPIKLLVDFIQTWFSSREINGLFEIAKSPTSITRQYLNQALRKPKSHGHNRVKSTKDLRALEDKTTELVRRRELDGALELLKEIASKRGSSEDHDKLGFILAAKKRTLEALSNFEKALDLDPLNKDALLHKQLAFIVLGRFQECIEGAKELIERDKNDSTAWDLLGVALDGAGRFEEALHAFEKSSELNPCDPDVLARAGGSLIKLKDFKKAIDWFDRAIIVDSHNFQALILKASVLACLDQNAEALGIFNRTLELDDTQEQAWLGKAMVLLNLERYQEALNCCEKALDLKLLTAQFYRVVALFALQKWDEYKRELEAFIRRVLKHHSETNADLGAILRHLLEKYSSVDIWNEKLRELLSLFGKYKILPQLAAAVSRTIPSLISDSITDRKAELWVKTCNENFSNHDEFALPLRLLETSLSYRKDRTPDVAVQLPSEERELFRNLINMYPDAQDPMNHRRIA